MNSKAKIILKNISYSFTSNLISMLISAIVTFIVPKLIGIKEYGYFQLYLFYSSYVGFLHFGWNDGIYLRYCGKEYKELDGILLFSQFNMLIFLQLILMIILFIASEILVMDSSKSFIFKMTALCMLFVNIRQMLLYILQGTNRIKEYSIITISEKILYCILLIFFIIVKAVRYEFVIVADLIGKLISLLYAMLYCKDIIFHKISAFYISSFEALTNISVGIKLMFSNIASLLIIGVIRFGIEQSWDVETFGKVSFTLSVSNLMMLFINAVGLVMFPILKRADEKLLSGLYKTMKNLFTTLILGALILYYPLRVILSTWLQKYSESLAYMALVFPICLFEGKMSLIVNPYLKTLRKEKMILNINLVSLGGSVILTLLNAFLLNKLELTILTMVVILSFRCILAELFLSRILGLSILKDVFIEMLMILVFIISGWYIRSWYAVIIYAVAYLCYLVIKKKDIVSTTSHIYGLIHS